MKSIGTCGNCKYYECYNSKPQGVCAHPKVACSVVFPLDDRAIHAGADRLVVGENFGCIHWKPKEGFVPRFELKYDNNTFEPYIYDNRTGKDLFLGDDIEDFMNGGEQENDA